MARPGVLLLYWNTMFGDPVSLDGFSLPEGCALTYDRARLDEADAVVFHLPTLDGLLPRRKRAGQLWVAWSMECESNHPATMDPAFLASFDVTMTYRRDSDVPVLYASSYGPPDALRDAMLWPPRPKAPENVAVMLVSSPLDKSGRLAYALRLMRHLPVHSYGRMLQNRSLPADDGRSTKLDLIGGYRFTLAFENARAVDYVTEKFYDPLVAGSVPVYLGAPNVDEYAPADGCYVDASRFPDPQALAEHLLALAGDEDAYGALHAWRAEPLRPSFDRMLQRDAEPAVVRLLRLVQERRDVRPAPVPPVAPALSRSRTAPVDHVPAVSVCMPTWNRAALLPKAIESVLAQTHEDFELVVVDDASDDDTAAVVASYGDPRVRYHRRARRGGIAAARNTCLEVAKGRSFAWLDSDDEYEPTALETLVSVLDAHPHVGLVHGGYRMIDREGLPLRAWAQAFPGDRIEWGRDALRELVAENHVTTVTVATRRSLHERVGGFARRMGNSCEDWDMWLRAALVTNFAYTAEVVTKVRLHGANGFEVAVPSGQRLRAELRACDTVLRQAAGLPEAAFLARRAQAARRYRVVDRAWHLVRGGRFRAALGALGLLDGLGGGGQVPDVGPLRAAAAARDGVAFDAEARAVLWRLLEPLSGSRFAAYREYELRDRDAMAAASL